MIHLLQLSDIHFHAFPGEDEDEFANMRERFFDDLDYVRDNLDAIDTVLICGDIAFSGKRKEYEKANDFIKMTLVKLTKGGSDPDVFMVPGNHDKDRDNHEQTRYLINTKLTCADQDSANKFFNSIRAKEVSTLKILYAPFTEYNNFASIYSSADDIANSIINEQPVDGKNVYSKRLLCNLGEYAVSLIGLNSALCCDKNDYPSKEPASGHKQFLPKVACNQVRKKYEIFISLMHHPLHDYVLNGDKLQTEFDNRFNVQLFGHIHKQSSFADNTVKIYSGALQPDVIDEKDYFPVYNIISLDVEGSELKVDIKARKWNGTAFVNYPEGSASHSITLAPVNTWTADEKKNAVETKQAVVDMDKKYRIQKRFMECAERKRRSLMDEYGYGYDNEKSDITNSMLFIKTIEANGKLDELEQKIS